MTAKRRIVKDYDALPDEIINMIKLEYPHGFEDNLISYTNQEGSLVSALPFDTEAVYYLVRMTRQEARSIIEEDEDYDEDGQLKDEFIEENFEGEEEAD